jgi:orotidine-5'-phosphate decarboxylase
MQRHKHQDGMGDQVRIPMAGSVALSEVDSASSSIPLRERLIVALDCPSAAQAEALVDKLGPAVTFYKVGLALIFDGGIDLAARLIGRGKKIFLDSKVLDIGNTVTDTVRNIARMGVSFVTIHGNGAAVRAAMAGRGRHDLKILSVTALTSLDAYDLQDLGIDCPVEEYVLRRTRSAIDAGCDGVIASGMEAREIRKMAGDQIIIVAPGIRSDGIPHDDQKRVMTPEEAITAGADYLVVGREIIQSTDPVAAAENIFRQIERGLRNRLN